MSSTSLEPEGSSLGGRLMYRLWHDVLYIRQYITVFLKISPQVSSL